mgnify:CR=1 FL=1
MIYFPMDIAVLIPMWNSQKKIRNEEFFLIEYTYRLSAKAIGI